MQHHIGPGKHYKLSDEAIGENKMRTLGMIAILLAVALSGCTTYRTITAETWVDVSGDQDRAYIANWEGKAMFDRGDARIEFCFIAKDNSLACSNQTDAERLLNVKGVGKGKVAEAEE
jgi:hypothetical protein